MNELTRRLPTGTYLEKFLDGGLAAATHRVEQRSLFAGASPGKARRCGTRRSLTGVLQSDTGGVDRFTITAELAGGEAKEKEAADGAAR